MPQKNGLALDKHSDTQMESNCMTVEVVLSKETYAFPLIALVALLACFFNGPNNYFFYLEQLYSYALIYKVMLKQPTFFHSSRFQVFIEKLLQKGL